ncbi:MAG: ribosome maturation factor RimP [Pseudomonadota bacterium]
MASGLPDGAGDAAARLIAKTPRDEQLARLIGPAVAALGYELVRVRLMGGSRPVLQIMAERPDGSMNVDDCAEVSRHVSAVLDVDDPVEDAYTLEVSSPGIDRPLTRLSDFARFEGHEAKLELRDPMEGRKRFRGALAGVAEGAVRIDVPDFGAVSLPFEGLSDAKLILTDALIDAALKARPELAEADADAALVDGAEVDLEGAETEDAPPEADADRA